MRSTALLVLAGLAAGGCKKESANKGGGMGGEPIAAASTDPLWAFAPAGATVAIVLADGVLEPVYRGGLKALVALDKAPGGAEIAGRIRQRARSPIGDVLDRATLDALGIDLGKGAAYFETERAKIVVLPIGDAAKFAGKIGAPIENGVTRLGPLSCKQVSGRFLCADDPAALDAAGKGGGGALVASWPRGLRGHVEVFIAPAKLDADIPLAEPGGLRMSAVLERGALTARVHVVGKPTGVLATAKSGKTSLVAGVAEQQPTGLFLVSAAGLWKMGVEKAAAEPSRPMPGGVNVQDLLASMSGEAIGYVPPGLPLRGIGKIGLSNAGPASKLIAACEEFAAMAPSGLSIKKSGERCAVSIDPAALGAPVPGVGKVSFDVWVESNALVVGVGNHAAKSGASPGLAPFAREVMGESWLFAAWGRGTLAGGPLMADAAQLDALRKGDPTGGLGVWGIHHLNEFGAALKVSDDGMHGLLRVRTLWANPDEVVDAVEEKIADFARGDDGALAAMAAVATKYPDSPFARDVQAGAGGLMAPVALAGLVAAVSIPAFVKYQKRSESTEARMNLMKMYQGAREYWFDRMDPSQLAQTAAHFPTPGAGPTPPLGTCCQQGGTCQPSAAWWDAAPWKALKFSIDDPHRYSYEYKVQAGKPGAVDGSHNFTVLAYGDLDCDGTYSTFSMRGVVDATYADGPASVGELERVDEDE